MLPLVAWRPEPRGMVGLWEIRDAGLIRTSVRVRCVSWPRRVNRSRRWAGIWGLSEALCWVSLTCDMGVVRAVMRVVEVVISGSSST